MDNNEFEHAPLKAGIDSIVALLQRTNLAGYKTLLWPANELRDMIEPLARRQGITVRTYRELRDTLNGDAGGVAGYLPAIAAWIVSDRSDGMALFAYMDRGTDQMLGPYQFRHLATTPNGTVTLFDIRNAQTGRPLPAIPGSELQ
jgi:hypothetical protein